VRRCSTCGDELLEVPADAADWPDQLQIWVSTEGTWGCWTEGDGSVHLHVPEDAACDLCGEETREGQELGAFWRPVPTWHTPEGEEGTAGYEVLAHADCGLGAGLELA
jgi:hypothetical protein